MTREETQKLLLAISSIFPNFNVKDKTLTVDSWQWALEEFPAPAVKNALQVYIRTNKSGFAPSVSQLINLIYDTTKGEVLSEGEAWALVKKAIQDGNYHAEERFNELPENIQKAVGGAGMIRQWAQTDTSEVNTVVMSNFQRSYKSILSREEFNTKIPPQLTTTMQNLIGEKDET